MPVPEAATVCHKCGKDPQSISRWRGFLASGQGVLSLLVALFSVSGTIIALLSGLTFFHESSTDVSFSQLPLVKSTPAERELWIKVVAYNSGNSPAFLSGARLVSSFESADWKTPLDFEPIRIGRDDPQVLSLKLNGGWDLQQFRIKSLTADRYQKLLKAPHRIEIGIQEFGEQLTWREVKDVPAPELMQWLSDVTMEPDLTAEAVEEK